MAINELCLWVRMWGWEQGRGTIRLGALCVRWGRLLCIGITACHPQRFDLCAVTFHCVIPSVCVCVYIRVTLYWGNLILLWLFHLVCILYCGYINFFCNVRVRAWVVMASGREDKIVYWHKAFTELRVLKNIVKNLSRYERSKRTALSRTERRHRHVPLKRRTSLNLALSTTTHTTSDPSIKRYKFKMRDI